MMQRPACRLIPKIKIGIGYFRITDLRFKSVSLDIKALRIMSELNVLAACLVIQTDLFAGTVMADIHTVARLIVGQNDTAGSLRRIIMDLRRRDPFFRRINFLTDIASHIQRSVPSEIDLMIRIAVAMRYGCVGTVRV